MMTCDICGRPLDDGSKESENCGGTCCKCMADFAGDPDCQKALYGRAEEDEEDGL